jgi:hypothetical protein
MAGMVSRITTSIAGQTDHASRWGLINTWLSDGVACGHSDLLYLAKYERPLMWSFSPFESRPLGRQLPHILRVCACQQRDEKSSHVPPRRARKVWITSVTKGEDDRLCNMKLKVRCSVCNRAWYPNTQHMDGYLYQYAGLYATIVPYFRV